MAWFKTLSKKVVSAYLSTAADTVITLENRRYVFQGTFTNTINEWFSLAADWITLVANNDLFCIEFMFWWISDKAWDIKIGIVKNWTFVWWLLDAAENILPWSWWKDFADTVWAPNGEINPRCFYLGEIARWDKITLVVLSTVANTTITPDGASAMIHTVK